MKWQRFYGKVGNDIARRLVKASDGNVIIGGNSEVTRPDGSIHTNVWIVKVDTAGHEMWEREFFLDGSQELRDLTATYEGGVIFSGVTTAIRNSRLQQPVTHGDYFVGHLDSLGKVSWMEQYGGKRLDQANAISRGLYREYVIAGGSHSAEGEVANNFGQSDIWFLKIDTRGKKRFSKVMGASRSEWATTLTTCRNGDYLLAGYTNSPDIGKLPVSPFGNGLVIRLDQSGQTLWTRTFPCPKGGYFTDIEETAEGRIVLAGNVRTEKEGNQFWLLKLTAEGAKVSEEIFGLDGDDFLSSLTICPDGGYLLGGYTIANRGVYSKGGEDFWIIRTNVRGKVIWRNTFGGPDNERCNDVLYYAPGVIFALGEKYNNFQEGRDPKAKDYWLIKLEEKPCKALSADIFVRAKDNRIERQTRVRFKSHANYGDKYSWDFGDGTRSTEADPLKSYRLPGMYNVSVTIQANEGCRQTFKMKQELEVY